MHCPYCKSENVDLAPAAVQSHALHHPDFYQCKDCGKQFSVTKTPRQQPVSRPTPPRQAAQVVKQSRGNRRGARGR